MVECRHGPGSWQLAQASQGRPASKRDVERDAPHAPALLAAPRALSTATQLPPWTVGVVAGAGAGAGRSVSTLPHGIAARRGAAGVVPSCDGPGAGIRCSAMAFADGGAWRRCSLILGPTASPPAAPDAPGGAGGHVRSARCGNRSLIGQAASSWFVASDCSPPLPAAACSWLIAAGNQEVDPRVLLAPRRVRGPQQAATAGCVLHAHPHLHTDSSS